MEYTKESIVHNWLILNSSSNDNDNDNNNNSTTLNKANANTYLTAFKQSKDLMTICTELFTDNIPNTNNSNSIKFFATLLIYQHIKENIVSISANEAIFNYYKSLLFNSFFSHITINTTEIILSNICQSITLLVMIGKVTYWENSIEDILQMALVSEQNYLCAVIILSNCHKELEEMIVNETIIIDIKLAMIKINWKVQKFLIELLSKMQLNNATEKIIKAVLDLTGSWMHFGIDIMTIENYPLILLHILSQWPSNGNKINQIFDICFYNSSLSLSSFLSKSSNDSIQHFLMKQINHKKELQILIRIIINIYEVHRNIKGDSELFFYIANIFSSLSKHYVYLFFLSIEENTGEDNGNIKMMMSELFLFFISCKRRKVSDLFFESIEEMKNIIIQFEVLKGYTINQRNEIKEYLYKINNVILTNAKMKSLKVDFGLIDKKIKEGYNSDIISILEDNDDEDEEMIDFNDTSLKNYRKGAEQSLYDIFLIFINNYPDDEIQLYFNRLGEILSIAIPIKNSNNQQQHDHYKEYLILVEVILFNIRSIRDCFDSPGIDNIHLFNFISFLLNSSLLSNEKLMINFIIFLDSFSSHLHKNTIIYKNTINFLQLIMIKYKAIEKICALIILNIVDQSNNDNEVCEILLKTYVNYYQNLTVNALCLIGESVIRSNCNGKHDSNKMIAIAIKILQPANDALKLIFDNQNQTYNSIMLNNLQIVTKSIEIYKIVIKSIGLISKDFLLFLLNYIEQQPNTLFTYNGMIINTFSSEYPLIKSIIYVYTSMCYYLKNNSLNFFTAINNFIMVIYSKHHEAYDIISLMKTLYIEAIKQPSSSQCQTVISQLFPIIKDITSTIFLITKNKLETIQLFASFIGLMLEHIPYIPINQFNHDIMDKTMRLFSECNRESLQKDPIVNIIQMYSKIFSSKVVPKEFKMKYVALIIREVIDSLNYYDKLVGKDIGAVLINARCVDKEIFNKVIIERIDKSLAETVIAYFDIFGRNESKVKIDKLMSDMINLKKNVVSIKVMDNYIKELTIIQMKNIPHQ